MNHLAISAFIGLVTFYIISKAMHPESKNSLASDALELFVNLLVIALYIGIFWGIFTAVVAFKDRGKAVVYSLQFGEPEKIEFYLSEDKKYIVQKSFSIEKYHDCTVIDVQNWQCLRGWDNRLVEMRDGVLEADFTIKWGQEGNYEQVSAIGYYWEKFKLWIKGFLAK